MSSFTKLKLNYSQYEFYFPRKEILNFIKKNLDSLTGNLLDVGCGKKPYKSYILSNSTVAKYTGLDIENSLDYGGEKPEILWQENEIPAEDNTFNSAIATEVFEHVHNTKEVLSEIYRVLAPGAEFLITIPFLWPLHETPHDHYRYTPFALEKLLKDVGFKVIKTEGMGGWNASFGLMLALWTKRAFKRKITKIFFFILTYPIVWILYKSDKKPTGFKESTMITGLCIIAKK